MILTFVVCSIGITICLFGMRRLGYREGLSDGIHMGSAAMMREFCVGNMRIEGDKIILGGNSIELYTDDGNRVTEMSLKDIEFEEV